MNKVEALKRLSNLKREVKKIRRIIEANDTAEVSNYDKAMVWLKEYIKQPFVVKHTDGYITYYIDDQWIFQKEFKDKYLWCFYYKVWDIFSKEFSLNYKQIQKIHKEVVGEAFDCKEFTPLDSQYYFI